MEANRREEPRAEVYHLRQLPEQQQQTKPDGGPLLSPHVPARQKWPIDRLIDRLLPPCVILSSMDNALGK